MTVYVPPAESARRKKKRLPRLCLAIYIWTLVSIGLYIVFTQSPSFSDWFNQNISTWGRRLLAYLTAWIPFSVAEMLLLLLPVLAVAAIVIAARYFNNSGHDAWVYVRILFSIPCFLLVLQVYR